MALEDLEPALWRTLSDELLHHVFLRLPVPDLSQIRLLSKAWKSIFDSVDSYLSRALEDTVYPNQFGLIDLDGLRARVFDVKRNQWYIRSIDPSFDRPLGVGAADGELDCSDSESAESTPSTMVAADGGLVCFVTQGSESAKHSLSVVVMNPLTGEKVGLPYLLSMPNLRPTSNPSMVQLTMDRETNQYKVLVAGYRGRPKLGLFAQVYDSQTKQWSILGSGKKSRPGRIFGYEYEWVWMDDVAYSFEDREGPCLYDFADGELHRFNSKWIVKGLPGSWYALWGDRLFVLHDKRRASPSNLIPSSLELKCYISEYHLPKSGTAWVKVETHGCDPFEDFPDDDHLLSLHGCNGFLMVIGQAGELGSDNVFIAPEKYEFVWLYNLSTSKWQIHP